MLGSPARLPGRLFVLLLGVCPGEATGLVRADEVTVGDIPLIDGEVAAVWGAEAAVHPARGKAIGVVETGALPGQLAAGAATSTLALALGPAGPHVAGAEDG